MKASRSTLRTLASSVKQEASSGAASPYSWVNPASAGSSRSQRGEQSSLINPTFTLHIVSLRKLTVLQVD